MYIADLSILQPLKIKFDEKHIIFTFHYRVKKQGIKMVKHIEQSGTLDVVSGHIKMTKSHIEY